MEIEEAVKRIIAEINPIRESETVPLDQACGRVLAEKIAAPFAVPHFPKSAMDGYAVCAESVKDASEEHPVLLRVIGEILAGDVWDEELSNDIDKTASAVRVMTGALVPDGFDAVVKQEDTDYGESEVLIRHGVEPYMNYCKVGEDIAAGSTVLPAGRKLGRVEAGVLASLGISEVPVVRRPAVTVISTGSELKSLSGSDASGTAPGQGKIYNSIYYTLSASLTQAGFTAAGRVVPDEAAAIAEAIKQALVTSDVVITTGGVSVGKRDLLPEVLETLGAERVFAGVNIQPGTPTIGSVLNGKAILSLSGNPYAALVNFDLYFWPLAAKLTGCDAYLPKREKAVLKSEYPKVNRLRRFVRARAEEGTVTLPAKSHASSVLSNLLDCNCYIDLNENMKVSPGDTVSIVRMPE